jgi:hypothetical protein
MSTVNPPQVTPEALEFQRREDAARSSNEHPLLALARFGEKCLDAHRDGFCDLGGDWIQDAAVECGLLKEVQVTEACDPERCGCAEYGDFPQTCYQLTEKAYLIEPPHSETRVAPPLPMRMDEPWSLPEVLAKLIEATEHSLNVHSCDNHGHELYRSAAIAGRSILHEWQNTAPHLKAGEQYPCACPEGSCGRLTKYPNQYCRALNGESNAT